MVWAERRRLERLTAREAAGEDLWTDTFDHAARVKIAHMWDLLTRRHDHDDQVAAHVDDLMRSQLGIVNARQYPSSFRELQDTDLILSHIEAVYEALSDVHPRAPTAFEETVNEVLNDHRLAFKMVDGEVVPFSSDVLHTDVVEPVVRLMIGRDDLEKAQGAYFAALKEISRREPANAITDAGTALQEALVAMGCQGKSLGPLISDAKKRGLLAPHDTTLTDGIAKFLEWASADRSQTGDSHKHSDATLDDAWLMVHVVGSLILRLAGDARADPRQ